MISINGPKTKTLFARYLSQSLALVLPLVAGAHWAGAQDTSRVKEFNLVESNSPDMPRLTPVTRDAMKQYLEDLKDRTPRIPLPSLSDEEKKQEIENPRSAGYEQRLRTHYLSGSPNAYLTFGGSPQRNSAAASSNRPGSPVDPRFSLDYGFKVRMFWIAARANNCQYCLGHQESKLLGVGMTEDEIAALDCDWSVFPESEQTAFALAKRLTLDMPNLKAEDVLACKKYYSDMQLIEMLGSIAGNNAINRWKEGAGIPQFRDGGNFGGPANVEHKSYLTATSPKYADKLSKIVAFDADKVSAKGGAPTIAKHPPLLASDALWKAIRDVEKRTPRLPLTSQEEARKVLGIENNSNPVPEWQRLLANFPIAGKRLVDGVLDSKKSDSIDEKLQAKLDWVLARQDRAWYLTAIAMRDLKAIGFTEDQMELLDHPKLGNAEVVSEKEKVLLLVAKNLAASPIVLTDSQVQNAVEIAGPRAVTQVINYTCYRAALDRITEGAGLALEQ